jgi:hypothetical protein
MDTSTLITIATAIIAATATIVAAALSVIARRSIRRLEERFERQRESAQFLSEQLTKLYLPVSMHLRATRALADTHYEAGEPTKTEIEHALRQHNSAILELLMKWSMYLDSDAPDTVTSDLLEHLLQWESVYKLKYEYKVYDGPVWDGIRHYGYRKFPDGVDVYFREKEKELRKALHDRLQTAD